MKRASVASGDPVRFDAELRRREGVAVLGGVDEAGRGALAGPVVAAVAVFGARPGPSGATDSKALDAARREALVPEILASALDFGLGAASAAEVDRIDVLQATRLAVSRALAALREIPEFLVLDHLKPFDEQPRCLSIPKADATSHCVACASILAKVARDRRMALLDAEHPGYGFAKHKGYGTAAHWKALAELGPSRAHRRSFRGVDEEWFGRAPARNADEESAPPTHDELLRELRAIGS